MPGRATHRYPNGKPFPLALLHLSMVAIFILLVIYGNSWLPALGIAAMGVLLWVVEPRLHSSYESSGQAIRLPRRKVIVFPDGLPASMRILRYVFVLLVLVTLGLGIAPMELTKVKTALNGCILGMFALAFVYFGLYFYYLRIGKAIEVAHPDDSSSDENVSIGKQ